MYSSDFAEPLTLPSMMDSAPSTSDSVMGATLLDPNSPPEESVSILTSMGFPRAHSINALKAMVSPTCRHLLLLLTSLSAWVYRSSTRRMLVAGASRQPFHPLAVCRHVKGWQFHHQAWHWKEARRCRQTWWWPSWCHKWAWLAYLLTLQNANLIGPVSGWFKDVCSGWCLQIVPLGTCTLLLMEPVGFA